jgi:tetratricopeptide (TPR) repeat protein
MERTAILFLLVAFGALAGASSKGPAATETPALPRGKIVERVACLADPTETYALYLPSSYSPERRWPILYCFDPDGTGLNPVEQFASAAERFGWIVVGSWTSRNGYLTVSVGAAKAMWADAHKRFSIDDGRNYFAGYSGGARVATRIATACNNCVAGVVTCGAGFPGDLKPSAATKFAVFGTVGVDDFNFPEMRRLEGELAAVSVPKHFETFAAGHVWASKELCTAALGWFELEAMKSGRRGRDAALVDALYAETLARANALETIGDAYGAYMCYLSASVDFLGLRNVAEASAKAAELAKDPEVSAAPKRESDQIRKQGELARRVVELGNAVADAGEDSNRLTMQLRGTFDEINAMATASADSDDRRVARRARHEIIAYYNEGGMLARIAKDYDKAVDLLTTLSWMRPESAYTFYSLGRAYALQGKRKRALEALEKAVALGIKDVALFRDEPDLASLRGTPAFDALIERLSRPR